MHLTIRLLKSTIDGIFAHILHYATMAFLIWIGLYMADFHKCSFMNILGFVIVARQCRVIITAPWNHHIKHDRDKELPEGKPD